MPSVVGMLEEGELAARRQVEELREEADRVWAALQLAETRWERFVIAREMVGEVLTSPAVADGPAPQAAAAQGEAAVPDERVASGAASAGAVVPVFRSDLPASVLAVDYQKILTAVAEIGRVGGPAPNCRQIAAAVGLELVPTKIEGVRTKVRRLERRGWLVQVAPGRFTAAGRERPAAGS